MNDLVTTIKEEAQLDDAVTYHLRGFRLCASTDHEPDEITSGSFLLFVDLHLLHTSHWFPRKSHIITIYSDNLHDYSLVWFRFSWKKGTTLR
jgi:hypothetical protein